MEKFCFGTYFQILDEIYPLLTTSIDLAFFAVVQVAPWQLYKTLRFNPLIYGFVPRGTHRFFSLLPMLGMLKGEHRRPTTFE